MDTIIRKFNRQVRTFYVYSAEEADDQKLAYKDWRDAEPGTWAKTDDGYVVECLKSTPYTDRYGRTKCEKAFSIGRAWAQPGFKLEYGPRKVAGNFYGTRVLTWQEKEARTSRTKRLVDVYAQQVLTGKVDYTQLGQVYRPDQQIPEATVKRVLKQERIQHMIDAKLREILASKNITEDFVLDVIHEAINIAKGKGDPANMLRAAEKLAEWLGMDNKAKFSHTIEIGVSGDMERRVLEAEAELAQLEAPKINTDAS